MLEIIHKENELQTLTSALEALLVTAYQLSLREQDLQRRVRVAHDEYKKLADRVEGGFSDVEKTVVLEKLRPDDTSLPKLDPSLKPLDVVNHLRGLGHIQPLLADVVEAGVICSRSIAERSWNSKNVEVNPCVVAAKAQTQTRRPSLYERDFTTTNGVTGSLRCPFAKPSEHGHGKGKSTTTTYQDGQSSTTKCGLDPIKADLSQDKASSAGASVRSSTAAARCPIRYMDDHSPEELAKYFENHKHDLPRSHAICVNRFQRNESTMKQIDAKYGSLVSMIQGLGEKHKPLLPEAEQNGNGASSSERVEKWAEDVSSMSPHPATPSIVEEDALDEADALREPREAESDDRRGHFERPLREVRVGESPSRPWGIPVPVAPVAQVHGHSPGDIRQLHDSSSASARSKGKCPFDHTALKKLTTAAENESPIQDQPHPIRPDDGNVSKEAKPQVEARAQAPNNNLEPDSMRMFLDGSMSLPKTPEETVALIRC